MSGIPPPSSDSSLPPPFQGKMRAPTDVARRATSAASKGIGQGSRIRLGNDKKVRAVRGSKGPQIKVLKPSDPRAKTIVVASKVIRQGPRI